MLSAERTLAIGYELAHEAIIRHCFGLTINFGTPRYEPRNQVQVGVTGVVGFSYALQTSSNLLDWAPIVTNQSPFSFLQDTG